MPLFRSLPLIVALVLALAVPASQAADEIPPAQRSAFEKLIRDYLVRNPEVLLEAMDALEKKRERERQQTAGQRIRENRAELFEAKHDYVANPDGRIPVVEFFDYNCGYCKRVYPAIMAMQSREKDVRLIFKELPILGPASEFAAKAAFAAKRQGKYMPFHNALMARRGGLSNAAVMDVAGRLGLDLDRLRKDMKDPKIAAMIERNRKLANTMEIRGTPSMVIGPHFVPGAIDGEQMAALIDNARSNCQVC